jgi:alkylation response protein AidB-like acyl-CoA dehydrogenase
LPESLSPQLTALRDRVADFLTDELAAWESEAALSFDDPVPETLAARVRERSRELDLHGLAQPTALGGLEAGLLCLTVVREALAASNLRLARYVIGPDPGVLVQAKGALAVSHLEPVLRGEKLAAFAFTEPSDAARPTQATLDGDELVIEGRKGFVTGGADADFYNVLVNVRADPPESAGTAMVIVDRQTEGLVIEEKFRSLEGGHHVSLRFDSVRVPKGHILGEVGDGLPRALRNISAVRLAMSAAATGICLWTAEHCASHLQAPHRSGTPLGEHEAIRLRYADMRTETYAARSMLYRTARLAESGANVVNEVMATKIFTTETAGRVVDLAMQLVGGRALVEGHPLEVLYRRVRSMRLAEGASDLLRLHLARGRLELEKGRL